MSATTTSSLHQEAVSLTTAIAISTTAIAHHHCVPRPQQLHEQDFRQAKGVRQHEAIHSKDPSPPRGPGLSFKFSGSARDNNSSNSNPGDVFPLSLSLNSPLLLSFLFPDKLIRSECARRDGVPKGGLDEVGAALLLVLWKSLFVAVIMRNNLISFQRLAMHLSSLSSSNLRRCSTPAWLLAFT